MHAFVESHTAADLTRQRALHRAEQVSGSRQGQSHRAKLSQDLVPLADARTLLVDWDAGEDLRKSIDPMLRQVYRHIDCVDYPTEHQLDGAPRAVALSQLLEGDWLSAVLVIPAIIRPEDVINCVEEEASDPTWVTPLPRRALLGQSDEVIHEYIGIPTLAAGPWPGGKGLSRSGPPLTPQVAWGPGRAPESLGSRPLQRRPAGAGCRARRRRGGRL